MAFRGLLKSSDLHAVCEHQTANRGLDDQSAQQSNYLGALVGHSANPRRNHGRERQCCASTRCRPARAFVTDRRRSMRYLRFRHYDAGCSMPMPLELAQYRETLEWHQPILQWLQSQLRQPPRARRETKLQHPSTLSKTATPSTLQQ